MAGAYACQGDEGGAGRYYGQAASVYGLGGVDRWPNVCSVHRSLVSVLEQRPREDVDCPGGDAPEWRENEDTFVRDNPLTFDVDEAAPPETSEGSGTDSGGTDSGGTDTGGTDTGGTDTGGTDTGGTDTGGTDTGGTDTGGTDTGGTDTGGTDTGGTDGGAGTPPDGENAP
jgi:hypothetical protein